MSMKQPRKRHEDQQSGVEEREKRRRPDATGEIERTVRIFRGEVPLISRTEIVQLLRDALDVSAYGQVQYAIARQTIEKQYGSNENFWNDALSGKLSQGMRIQLSKFHVTEWIPSAPGRYFTASARESREIAKRYVDHEREEYLPPGKGAMVLGGVGSLRLASRFWGNKEVYPLGASSTGISHQGIPMFLNDYEYRQVAQFLHEYGGCLANVSGTVKIVSEQMLNIEYDLRVPKFMLVVDNVEILGRSAELLITVAVTFGDDRSLRNKEWSFCSFDPSHQSLNDAVDWLKDYSHRYSPSEHTVIMADFDEHMQHFEHAVEFPLADILRGRVDRQKLAEYEQAFHVTFNVQGGFHMDNRQDFTNATFNNFGGQQFIGRFNKTIANLNASGKQEFGDALIELARAVNNSEHLSEADKREKAEAIQQLGEEVAKPQPNKTIVRALGDSLIGALKSIPDIMKAATALAPFLQSILR